MQTDLSTYNNSWYNPGANAFKRILWYVVNAFVFKSSWFPISQAKVALLKLFGARIGKKVNIKPSVNIKYPWKLSIGDYTWIGENVWIDNLETVTIGSNCCISQGSLLLCGNHNFKTVTFDLMVGKILLEDGVWIGANATVCPGVTCKSHAILTAGSVATKSLEPFSIYQGNPAIKIKDRILTNP